MYHPACKVEFQPFTRSYSQLTFFNFFYKNHIMRTRLMYHAACKVQFQPFTRLYSQLTFFPFYKIILRWLLPFCLSTTGRVLVSLLNVGSSCVLPFTFCVPCKCWVEMSPPAVAGDTTHTSWLLFWLYSGCCFYHLLVDRLEPHVARAPVFLPASKPIL